MFDVFLNVCEDVTRTATKIPQSEYLSSGDYPIYDQGQKYVSGYSNDGSKIVKNFPYIIFGDHTRILKYVNNECYIGADGVKLLKVTNEKYLPKYVYYNLLANPIDNHGYSRHYKFLKELKIKQNSKEYQQKIIDDLDNTNKIIEIKQKNIAHLDELVKSRFIELFGDPRFNEKRFAEHRFDTISDNLDYRRIPITSKDRSKGKYPYYGASGIVDYVDDYIFDEDILLISEDGANLVMRSTPIAFSVRGKVWVNNHAHVVRFDNFSTQKYIEYYFAYIDISGYITGSAQPKFNQAKLNSMLIPVPPIDLQNEFANFVKLIDNYPIFTVNDLYNIDQIKAINIAMKSPASYIQGPPGTGKTQTILNAIFTAIFNNKTILVTSNNNIPMDGVYNAITSLKYNDKYDLLFPSIRLGSIDNIENAVLKIKSMYDFASKLDVRENQIKAIKEERKLAMKNLVELLDKHDKKVSINNRLEVLENIKNKYKFDNQFMRLTVDSQIDTLKKDAQQYESLDEDLTKYMNINHRQLFIAIHFETAGRLQKLKKEKYIAIYNIIKDVTEENKKERAKDLRQFLSKNENLQLFLEIFPVIISTNLSCTYLGEAGKHFDIVMMDEAAQCNITNALIPISRGNQIMLVGDAQQLSPVILLDENINKKLRAKYNIPEEYDYIKNSIYTAYTKIDVSNNEALLRDHYRCNKKIIQFSNQKYYNNMLVCKSKSNNDKPLEYFNTSKHQENSNEKNISEVEAKLIVDYIKNHPDEHVGVITPFVRQKECIEFYLSNNNIDVPVGTVHAFQGDQQNVILFSTAITNKTSQGTYNWLKDNKELINVAMSRAKDKFVMIANKDKIDQLSTNNGNDNIKELSNYVFNNGECKVQNVSPSSIALGTKHISSQSEEDLQKTISQILSVINPNCFIESEVAIDSCFKNIGNEESLFYKGRFDLVIFERTFSDKKKPILAVELNGPEHYLDEEIKKRDEIKKQICEKHGFQLLTIKREYARDYRQNKSAILELLK